MRTEHAEEVARAAAAARHTGGRAAKERASEASHGVADARHPALPQIASSSSVAVQQHPSPRPQPLQWWERYAPPAESGANEGASSTASPTQELTGSGSPGRRARAPKPWDHDKNDPMAIASNMLRAAARIESQTDEEILQKLVTQSIDETDKEAAARAHIMRKGLAKTVEAAVEHSTSSSRGGGGRGMARSSSSSLAARAAASSQRRLQASASAAAIVRADSKPRHPSHPTPPAIGIGNNDNNKSVARLVDATPPGVTVAHGARAADVAEESQRADADRHDADDDGVGGGGVGVSSSSLTPTDELLCATLLRGGGGGKQAAVGATPTVRVRWRRVRCSGRGPTPRYGHAMCAAGERLIVHLSLIHI